MTACNVNYPALLVAFGDSLRTGLSALTAMLTNRDTVTVPAVDMTETALNDRFTPRDHPTIPGPNIDTINAQYSRYGPTD